MVESYMRLTCDRCGVHEDVALRPDEWPSDVMRSLDERAKGWQLMDDVRDVGVTRYGELRVSEARRVLCPECSGEYADFLADS